MNLYYPHLAIIQCKSLYLVTLYAFNLDWICHRSTFLPLFDIQVQVDSREDAYFCTGGVFIRNTAWHTAYCIVIQWSLRSYFIESQWICRAVSCMKMPPVRQYASSLFTLCTVLPFVGRASIWQHYGWKRYLTDQQWFNSFSKPLNLQ